MRGNVLRAAKYVHHVYATGNCGYSPIHLLAEHFRSIGIEDRYRHDVVTGALCILRHEKRRAVLSFLDAEYCDATRFGDHPANSFG